MTEIKVGDIFIFERRFRLGGTIQHAWEAKVERVTDTRVYFPSGFWFESRDPDREVKPKYIDYVTTATPKRSTGA